MSKERCINAVTVISFFVGGTIGVGLTLLLAREAKMIEARLRSTLGKGEKLTREQIIAEGLYCAVPEGADLCFPEQEDEPQAAETRSDWRYRG